MLVIEEAISRIPDGEYRLAVSDYSLKNACLSEFYAPDLSEWLSSYDTMSSGNDAIEKQYFEEITTIKKIMADTDVPIHLADWQSRAKSPAGDKMFKVLNRRGYAIQVWEWYAIPWRYKDGLIHLIWAPQDVMGSPIIHSYSVNEFLERLSNKQKAQFMKFQKSHKQIDIWRTISIIMLFFLGITVYTIMRL